MSECEYKDIKDYKTAFECFKQRFLKDKKSIFRLEDSDEILNKESVKYLIDNFINNGYAGDASFIDKIEHQLVTSQNKADEQIQKNAIEVLAHCVWLWRLVPYNANMESTKKSVKEILELNKDLKDINCNNSFFNENIKGIASTGTYYNTNKPFELAFVIKFLEKYLEDYNNSEIDFINILNDVNNKISITTKGNLDKQEKFTKTEEKENDPKTASIFNALLHFFDPEKYEPIVSNEHKEKIVKALYNESCVIEQFDPEIDYKLACIRNAKNLQGTGTFYDDKIQEEWNPTILPGKNIIYYGAPGTGKTYSILKLVKRKAEIQDNINPSKYYKVVQFHPSYGYEDFIDGIKPVKSTDSNINLELVDGEFKKMCQVAFEELKQAKDEKREAKKFYFIADEINRAELSRVFGELLLCLEEDKRLRFENNKLLGTYIKTQNSALWEEKNSVLKIDNELYFGVPENIYFLATMNDIDKSIDSFDMALRRRFKWICKGCDYNIIYNYLLEKGVNDEDVAIYVSDEKAELGRCNILNKYIRKTLNLGKSYELGHSYFMNIKIWNNKISKSAYENLFDLELAPLLKEYIRAEITDMKLLERELKCMRKLFIEGKKCDKNS